MIQFNLLPDVKLEYLKTTRIKRSVMIIASITASVALAVFIALFVSVRVLQKNHLSDLDMEVKSKISDLRKIPDINKILTVQNQLNSLTGLHDQKAVASRLFGYLIQMTPKQATISKLATDFSDAKSMQIEGVADSIKTINEYADTIKFTQYSLTYTEDEIKANKKNSCAVREISYDENTRTQVCAAFNNVVLEKIDIDKKTLPNNVVIVIYKYKINLVFDPMIFDNKTTNKPVLNVPKITTTRSELSKPSEKPAALFEEAPKDEEGNN